MGMVSDGVEVAEAEDEDAAEEVDVEGHENSTATMRLMVINTNIKN